MNIRKSLFTTFAAGLLISAPAFAMEQPNEQEEIEQALEFSLAEQAQPAPQADDELERALALSLEQQPVDHTDNGLEQAITNSLVSNNQDETLKEQEDIAFITAISISEQQEKQKQGQKNARPEKTINENDELEKLDKVNKAMSKAENQARGRGFDRFNERRTNLELGLTADLNAHFADKKKKTSSKEEEDNEPAEKTTGKQEEEDNNDQEELDYAIALSLANQSLDNGHDQLRNGKQEEVLPARPVSLHEAAQQGDLATVKRLIESGAKFREKDSAGKTAYEYAEQNRAHNVLTYLRRKALEQDSQCPVCMENEFADDQLDVASSTCMHFICKDCKDQLKTKSFAPEADNPYVVVTLDKCPICRTT